MQTPKALSRAQAERLVQRINASVEATVDLIIEAFEGQAHLALGYSTWQEFAANELPHYKYSPADRMKASVDLTEAGLSTRSAAAALGVNHSTVAEDVKTAAAVGNPTPTAPKRPRKRKDPTEAARAGAKIQRQVDRYLEVMTKHPTWSVKDVQEHLDIPYPKTVSRLRLWAQAPGEAQQYLFSGQITPAVAEAVLAFQYASDEAKMVVLRKMVAGVIIHTGTPKVRKLMELIPQIQPYPDLVLRWSSPDLGMTDEQLSEELIDLRNSRAVSKKEQARRTAETKMLTESGFNAVGWLDEVAGNLDLVEEMWPVLSANSWVRAKLQQRLAETGNRMLRLSEQGQQLVADEEDEEPSHSPLVIAGEIVS